MQPNNPYVVLIKNLAEKACLAYMEESVASFPRLAQTIVDESCTLIDLFSDMPTNTETITDVNTRIQALLLDCLGQPGVPRLHANIAQSYHLVEQAAIAQRACPAVHSAVHSTLPASANQEPLLESAITVDLQPH